MTKTKQPTRTSGLIRCVLAVVALLAASLAVVGTAGASSHRGTIVVANRGSADLTLIDVATDTPTTLAMPSGEFTPEPMYVVSARGSVFVGDRANDRVVVFDADTWDVVGDVPAGDGVFHMWADPVGKQLWVNNDVDNTITVIDIATLGVNATIAIPADLVADGAKPHDVILDRNAAYVTMLGLSGVDDAVVKYDARTYTEVGRAAVGKDPHVTLAPQGNTLYVAAQNSNEVRVLNRSDLSLVSTIAAPGAHGIDITRNGKVVYSTNISGGGVDGLYAIDTSTNTMIGDPVDTPFETPHNMVLTHPNRKLYVTHSGATADQVSVYGISPQNPVPVLVTTVTAGLNPFGIEFVP